MGNMLEAPITKKDTHEFKFPCGSVGISGMQGWRIEMEDAHLAVSMPSLPDHVYLCVFDGHGGAGASAYAAKNIVSVIEGTETWKKYVASSKKDPVMVGEALEEAFIALDVNLRAFQQTAENNGDTSGTTVNTCMVTPNHYICANAGDSRCVLGSSNKTIAMSVDHKPTDPIERTRIEKAGGTVQMGRVDGDLAVSRGFGDFAYKGVAALPAREQRVSCIPDIKIVERTDNDEVLLLACDGLWDVMSNEQSMLAMREMFKEGESEPALMVEEMLDLSLQLGSKDNISAVALLLPGSKALIASDGEGVIGRRELRDMEAHKAQQERASAAEDEDDDDGPSCPAGFSKQKGTCPFGAGKM